MVALSELQRIYKEDRVMALVLANEDQCHKLIEQGHWDEDDFTYQQDLHEELRVEIHSL